VKVRYSYLKEKFGDKELRKKIYQDFDKLLDEGDFTLGAAVTEFENRFAKLIGARHAIGVANGTDAIRLALKAVGVGPGDEVITGASSFIASAGAIAELYARPVFVDMAPWFTLDADLIEDSITEHTKAILPVHFTGEPAEMDKILEIGMRHNIPIVEDCAQAVLAKYKGVCCGNFGRAGAFSLHPLKNLNVWGDGGIIVTNDDSLNKQFRLMRNHGLKNRDEVMLLGCNSRLDTLQAIVGNALIDSTAENIRKRRENAAYYDKHLSTIENITPPLRRPYVESCFHLYMFEVTDDKATRNGLVEFLNLQGIEAKVHYPIAMYKQDALIDNNVLTYCPVAECQANSIVTLPVDEHMTKEMMDYCISKIREFYA
jgi:aminotransferase EvaB